MNHVHHAGNSSGIVDGSAAVLLGSKAGGEKLGMKPRARIRAMTNIGSEPAIMLTGPVDVTRKLLDRAGMELEDIDLFELNEAFASVVLRYMQAFDIPHDKINVNGGAIAMGHPLGATGCDDPGARCSDELERQDKNTALVTAVHRRGNGDGDDHRTGVKWRFPRAQTIRNERVKLTATYLNSVAIATIAIGGIAPWVAFASGASTANAIGIGILSAVSSSASVLVHVIARVTLKRIVA